MGQSVHSRAESGFPQRAVLPSPRELLVAELEMPPLLLHPVCNVPDRLRAAVYARKAEGYEQASVGRLTEWSDRTLAGDLCRDLDVLRLVGILWCPRGTHRRVGRDCPRSRVLPAVVTHRHSHLSSLTQPEGTLGSIV